MTNLLFLASLAVGLAVLDAWAFRNLPHERWQFLAAAPTVKIARGRFAGVNFTFYGFFAATAQAAGAALFVVLLAAVGVPASRALLTIVALALFCCVVAHLMVRLVEGARHGFTVGGAAFAGALVAWPVARLVEGVLPQDVPLPLLPLFAALGVAYTLGESLGRLACISFGCCYGKPWSEVRGLWRLADRFAFRFTGATRKAVFAGQLEGVPVVPIQAISAVVLGALCLVSTALFLNGRFTAALLVAVAGSQLWRAIAETVRNDYQSRGKSTPYQRFAAGTAALALLAAWLIPSAVLAPDLAAGLASLWNPLPLLTLELLWLAVFFLMGRSTQTRSALQFGVHPGRV